MTTTKDLFSILTRQLWMQGEPAQFEESLVGVAAVIWELDVLVQGVRAERTLVAA